MLSTQSPPIQTRTLDNGLTVVVQPMPWLRTAAYTLWLPAGITTELVGLSEAQLADTEFLARRDGLASLTCEMVQRGAGAYNSRQLVAAEDNLGIDSGNSAATSVAGYSARMPAESLLPAIELLADVVRRPHLPGNQFDDAKMILRQELAAFQDEPTQRLMRRLRERQYGPSLGRGGYASEASLEALSMDDVRQFYTDQYHAGGSVLAVAGNFDANQIFDSIEQSFGDWKSGKRPALPSPAPIDGNEHIELPSSQTHIGFSFDSIPYGSDDYFVMRAGIGILSDGMSSRLFDRVREQRGLCYSVWASTHTIGQHGAVFGYAGTTPARAQETLDVSLREIQHLADDLEQEELSRWKVRIESGLIMEQESAGSRASSLASDQYQLGRVIPTEELEAKIEAITLDQVASYFRQHGPRQFRIVTVGPEALQGGETLA
ncbi:MAG: M16 family metallopeptidase [Rhodopirellula sp. JB055]|uniref:M16 family metallopeptidase n=1 Tax=Rhodopirellula sp. JB055 TaxID=3342846 RepID=UPI00370B2C5D